MAIFKMFKSSALELKSLRCLTVTAVLIALDLALKSVTINVTEELKISFAFLALATIGMLFGPTVSMLAGIITDLIGFFTAPQIGAFNPMYTIIEATGAMLYGLFLYKLQPVKLTKEMFKPNIEPNTAALNGINAKLLSALMILSAFVLYSIYKFNELFVLYVVVIALLYGIFLHKLAVLTWKQLMRVIGAKVTVVVICNLIMTPLASIVTKFFTYGTWIVEPTLLAYPARLLKNAIQCPVDIVLLTLVLFPIMTAYKSIFKGQSASKGKKDTAKV